ncbi:sortase, marine proteobacterial type [Alteromonas lipolytica]|uniref:Sortase, marine proteobacterial type n=2 Tax=Alteromonas lipolytica TaxID=1856405 RepID=A0A1E8FJU6_9ALTE|nr:sortase, marine proteobacterial type [Alteromonas lipolytica]
MIGLLVLITLCWGNTLWIKSKALLAQYLIASAWQQSLHSGQNTKPWAWADTWPVARLDFTSLQKQLYVLAGSTDTALAFGPGLADGTALPEAPGTMVIHGHRDTHFSLLADLHPGDKFALQSRSGKWLNYEVTSTNVIDTRTTQWLINPAQDQLLLITCYPFDGLNTNPPLRYVVTARLAESR